MASNHARCGEATETGRAEETDEDAGRGRDQSQSAKTQKEGCEPTIELVSKSPEVISMQLAYLDLQHIVAADPLVVHLMVRVVGITTILVLHERKAVRSR